MLRVYIALTLIGTLVPWFYLGQFLWSDSISGVLPTLMMNNASISITADLAISSFVFWVLLLRAREPFWPLLILLNLCLGLSAALPAFLYLQESREKRRHLVA